MYCYLNFSISIKKEIAVPPFPVEKSFQICLLGETTKLGSCIGTKPEKRNAPASRGVRCFLAERPGQATGISS